MPRSSTYSFKVKKQIHYLRINSLLLGAVLLSLHHLNHRHNLSQQRFKLGDFLRI